MTGSEQKVTRKRSPVSGRRSSGSQSALSSLPPSPPLLSTRPSLSTMHNSSSSTSIASPPTSPRGSIIGKCNEVETKSPKRNSSHNLQQCVSPRGLCQKSLILTEGFGSAIPSQYVHRNVSVMPHGRHASPPRMSIPPPVPMSPSVESAGSSGTFGPASYHQTKRSSQTLIQTLSSSASSTSSIIATSPPALNRSLSHVRNKSSMSNINLQLQSLIIDVTLADEISDLLRATHDQTIKEKLNAVAHVCNDYFVNILLHEYEWIGSNLQAPVRLKKQILEILNSDNFYGIQKKLDEMEKLIINNNYASLGETVAFDQISNYSKFEYLNMSAVSVLGRFLKNEISSIDSAEFGFTKEKFEDHIRISLRENIPIIIDNFKRQIGEKNNEYKQLVLSISAVIEKGRVSYLYNRESIIADFNALTDSSTNL